MSLQIVYKNQGQTHLFFDFLGSIMPSVQESLPSLVSRFETVLMSVNLALILRKRGCRSNIQSKHNFPLLLYLFRCSKDNTLCSWWRSSRASAPATSLASSSALIRAFISVTQLVRSRKSAVKRCSLETKQKP